jgi:hypothetical protein
LLAKNDISHGLKVEINLKHFNDANNTVYPNNPHELQRQINEGIKFTQFLQHFKPIQPHTKCLKIVSTVHSWCKAIASTH